MEFKTGDWVRTKSGEEGRVKLLHRLSAFIELSGNDDTLVSCLLSELTKIDPPPTTEEISSSGST